MALAEDTKRSQDSDVLPNLTRLCAGATDATAALLDKAKVSVRDLVSDGGKLDASALEREQHTAHGLSWLATYTEALKQMAAYAQAMESAERFGEIEALITQIAFGEYLNQIVGGIPMSQCEMVRPSALGLTQDDIASFISAPEVSALLSGNSRAARAALSALIAHAQASATFGDTGLDETYEAMREEMRRFADTEVIPLAHEWHLANDYVPMEVIEKMCGLGVFGLTIPEEHDGLGLGKESMVVVSEELSRGYIGVGSLGTRSEIAAELILHGGTDAQKEQWLPGLASGEIIPTAVFTEPNVGSDMASLKTRAVRDGDVYRITGQKTWITHAARADMMTLLARTDPDEKGYRGLSMFLIKKSRGDDANPFPDDNITGGEIEVLGYRGMKEYDVSFDGFEVPADALLGGVEGQGFKQLMATFEGARIQTAARAIGVAQNALELALLYAQERQQFGKALIAFPRVSDKIVMMAVEVMIARQLTYFAAREKDAGHRCDLVAGMAKLLSARIAWAASDNALQIHGGNGFALEYPVSRVLCDARILSIFEGAAEIQANVIARRVLEG